MSANRCKKRINIRQERIKRKGDGFMEEVLNERKQKILKAIIKTYMETGRTGWFQDHFQVCGSQCQFRNDPK